MAAKKKVRKKVAKKKGRQKGQVATKPVVTQNRLQVIRDDLDEAAKSLRSALAEASRLELGEREDTRRAYQQINNALIRCDAAIDELAI